MFCELFGFSKQAYYKANKQITEPDPRYEQAKNEVHNLRRLMPRLGTRKLYHLLKDKFAAQHLKVGRDKLFTLLREDGLLVVKKKKYVVTTDARHWMHKYPNIIKDMPIERPEQLWVADITYIDVTASPAYLHLITDAYSKQIMGYELSNNMEACSTLQALNMALKHRIYPDKQLIHHSDRGSQYCSDLYTKALMKDNVTISMTENGDPYENAIAERINGILKDEFGMGDKLVNMGQALSQIKQGVKIYNSFRPHLSCELLTPYQMHQQDKIKVKKWHKKKYHKETTLAKSGDNSS